MYPKKAIGLILKDIKIGEHFNIITFSSDVSLYSQEMVKMTEDEKLSALEYVKGLKADGSTNINKAFMSAVNIPPTPG